MRSASLRFANQILQRLGEELNPSPVNGIIELVKNAYDANAKKCRVSVRQPSSSNGKERKGHIIVEDDGDGMSIDDIVNGWLILGRSRKKADEVTRLGRNPVGDKGLGRLSALRLGERVTVTTRSIASPAKEHELVIDWSRFDSAALPEDVPLTISTRASKEKKPGTTIRIDRVLKQLDGHEINRLGRNLNLIANPFQQSTTKFSVELELLPAPLKPPPKLNDLFGAAQLVLDAKVSARGDMTAALRDSEGKLLANATKQVLSQKIKVSDSENVPRLEFKLWIYVMQSSNFRDQAEYRAVSSWLKEFGGVHIFVDDVRVSPYGDPGDDWIGMNALRAASPEMAPTTTTSIGFLSLKSSTGLRQKTDRSGFLESPTFSALREFILSVLKWQQTRRVARRQKVDVSKAREAARDFESAKSQLSELLASAAPKTKVAAEKLVTKLAEATKQTTSVLEKEVALYRTLSTAGIAASVFAHEAMQNRLNRIRSGAKNVELKLTRFDESWFRKTLKATVDRIVEDTEALTSVADVTLALVRARKRQNQKIDVLATINEVVKLLSPFFLVRNAEVVVLGKDGGHIWGKKSFLEAALVNLIANGLQATEQGRQTKPRIEIQATVVEGFTEIVVSDNGLGLVGIDVNDIWLPGETTRVDGTGLGLTIVRSAARDLGGTATAVKNGGLGGASFKLRLPTFDSEQAGG